MQSQKNLKIDLSSLIFFVMGVFTFISLVSYDFHDPSFFNNYKQLSYNYCGRIGAHLASFLLVWLGIGAFLVPAGFLFVASNIYKRRGFVQAIGTFVSLLIALSALSVFLELHWKYWSYGGSQLLTGGLFGAWFADALVHQLNFFGSSLVVLLIFLIALSVAVPMSLVKLGVRLAGFSGFFSFSLSKWMVSFLLGICKMIYLIVKSQAAKAAQMMKEPHLLEASKDKMKALLQKDLSQPLGPQIGSQKNQLPLMGRKVISEPEFPLLGLNSTPLSSQEGPPFELTPEDCEVLNQSLFQGPSQNFSAHPLDPLRPELGGSREGKSRGAGEKIKILPRQLELVSQGSPEPMRRQPTAQGIGAKKVWKLPPLDFLKKTPQVESAVDREKLIANSYILKQKFADFGIQGDVTAVRPGPVITLYEFKPGPGVKVSRIAALSDDLSMALSAQSVRILAPLPGKSVVGIEIPSEQRETVYLREMLQHADFCGNKHVIPMVMGKDIGGQTYISDLSRMPHLLCAGQTGSGKSVFMNGLICSLFYRFTPDELRMILVDPKFIEFRAYQDVPHLLLPVVDNPKQASIALKWAVREMERRYRILAKIGARNLASFNQRIDEMGTQAVRDLLVSEPTQADAAQLGGSTGAEWMEAFELDAAGVPQVGKLPYIVVIIDELADLMMIARKEVEISIARIAQKARAAGIHLIIATQRPSTDVVTGLIKANLPSRVSFQLSSYVDSKTILDRAGADRLLGQGDMLFIPPGVSQTLRLHGAFLDDEEINKITSFLRSQGVPSYKNEILFADEEDDSDDLNDSRKEGGRSKGGVENDELFSEGVELVRRSGHASASFLQRHLKVGYNRAARMIETMESRGIVGPQDGARPRDVLIRE